jgi:hypothetical protein
MLKAHLNMKLYGLWRQTDAELDVKGFNLRTHQWQGSNATSHVTPYIYTRHWNFWQAAPFPSSTSPIYGCSITTFCSQLVLRNYATGRLSGKLKPEEIDGLT